MSNSKTVPRTTGWHDLDVWQRDNEYILTGYRRLQYNWKGTFESLYAYMHNETINIHTHLLAALLFLSFSFSATTTPMLVFTLSATTCLSFFSFYHLSSCHSPLIEKRCHAFDYIGIVILIVGSVVPFLWYSFPSCNRAREVYMGIITTLGLLATYTVLNPTYATPLYRAKRTAVFITLGLSAVLPLLHLAFFTSEPVWEEMGLEWVVGEGVLYIAGALLYANRIPEKWNPGKYDIVGASHQIFHVCVVLAALCHYKGLGIVYEYRMGQGACL